MTIEARQLPLPQLLYGQGSKDKVSVSYGISFESGLSVDSLCFLLCHAETPRRSMKYVSSSLHVAEKPGSNGFPEQHKIAGKGSAHHLIFIFRHQVVLI